MQISRAALGAAIDEAHRRGMKVTGHLCSVTYAEAADLGIDNLEHGFLASTDFVADKQPDVCPGQGRGQQTIAALDEHGAPFKALVKKLVDKRVALTSTLTVFETFTPGRPMPPGLDVLTAVAAATVSASARARRARTRQSIYTKLFPKALALERAFARAGGLLHRRHRSDRIAAASFPATRISGRSSCWSKRASRRSKRSRSAR